MSRTVLRTITLSEPIQLGKRTVDEITVYQGRLGDLRDINIQAGSMPMADIIAVASRMCGEVKETLYKLHENDAREVIALALDFIGSCLTIGDKPPED